MRFCLEYLPNDRKRRTTLLLTFKNIVDKKKIIIKLSFAHRIFALSSRKRRSVLSYGFTYTHALTVTVYMQRGVADAHLPARRSSGHADDEGLPVRGPIPGRVTWHCLAVSQHASSAGQYGSLTHEGAVPPPIWRRRLCRCRWWNVRLKRVKRKKKEKKKYDKHTAKCYATLCHIFHQSFKFR